MNTETSQKMTYQEREAVKGFTDKRALQGDTLLAGRYCFWEAGRCAGEAPERRPCERGRQYATQPVDRAGRRYTAGVSGSSRQCDQRQNGTPRREGRTAGTGNGRAETCAAAIP